MSKSETLKAKEKELIKMILLQYFIAFLVFFAGFAIIDANMNGEFKHNEIMGFLGALLLIASAAILFL